MTIAKTRSDTMKTRLLHLVDQRAALDAEGPPWEAKGVAVFARDYEIDPKSAHDLFKIALSRFEEIKALVECHDFSARDELNPDSDEEALQKWLCRKLEERGRGRYSVAWSPQGKHKKRTGPTTLSTQYEVDFNRGKMGGILVFGRA